MTLTEKILARASAQDRVGAGDIVHVKVDLVLVQEATGPLSVIEMRRMGAERVFDVGKVVVVCDHFVPNATVDSAGQTKLLRDFSQEQGLAYYYEAGRGHNFGVEHALLPEEGLIRPGMVRWGFASRFGSTDVVAALALGISCLIADSLHASSSATASTSVCLP